MSKAKRAFKIGHSAEDEGDDAVETSKVKAVATSFDDDAPAEAPPKMDEGLDKATEPVGKTIGELPEEKPEAKKASRSDPKELVKVVCLRGNDSPVVVGDFRSIEYGITELKAGKNYVFPRFVAEVLADRPKMVSILE